MKAIIHFKHQRYARSKAKAGGGAPPLANSAATPKANRNAHSLWIDSLAPADGGRQTLELDRTAAPLNAATAATAATAPAPPCAAARAPAVFLRRGALPPPVQEKLSRALKATASIPLSPSSSATGRSGDTKIQKSVPHKILQKSAAWRAAQASEPFLSKCVLAVDFTQDGHEGDLEVE
jgi:hypothetical protein